MDVFDLFAKLSLDTSEYDKGLTGAETKASDFGTKFASAGKAVGAGFATVAKVGVAAVGAATAVTGALIDGAQEAASYGDNIDKMSQKLGLSAEAYQEWDAVMQHAGTSIESMQRGMTTLAKAAETDSDAFKQLGISEEELASLSQEDLFARTIEGLQGMEAGTERTVLANKLLGGSAKELGALLNTSAEETQAMRDRVHELGGVMSDEAVKASAQFQDNLQDLQTAISGIKRGLTGDLLPSLNLIMDGFTALLTGQDGGPEKFAEGFSAMLEQVGDITARVVDTIKKVAPSIVTVLTDSLPEVVKFGVDLLTSIVDGIAENLDSAIDTVLGLVSTILESVANALPVLVGKIVDKLPDVVVSIINALGQIVPVIADAAMSLLETIVGKLSDSSGIKKIVTAGVNFAVNIGTGIVKGIPKLVKMIPRVLKSITTAITDSIPIVLSGVMELVNEIVAELPEIIAAIGEAMPELINTIVGYLVANMPILLDGVTQMVDMLAQSLPDTINALIDVLPEIITALVLAIVSYQSAFIQAAVSIAIALAQNWPTIAMALVEAVPQIIDAILSAFGPISDGIGKIFGDAWIKAEDAFKQAPEWFKSIFDLVKTHIKDQFDKVKENMSKVWQSIKDVFSHVSTWFKDKFTEARKNIETAFSTIGQFFDNVWENIKNAFHITEALEWGRDLIANFVQGIKDGWAELKSGLGQMGEKITDFIGFSEPKEGPLSKFHTFAPDMMALFAEGVTENADVVTDAVRDAFDFKNLIDVPEYKVKVSGGSAGGNGTSDGFYLQKMIDLLQEILDHGLDVSLEGDADDIFRVVENKNKLYTRTSGYNRLSMTEV